MIFRFSLYGFLKNQRYFEAFLVLAFLEKGLGFLQIGLLVACRELIVNLLEVPSGAIADVYGRRLVMILAFVAYVASFLVLGLAEHPGLLFVGMGLFGVGDSFRTGTHKAMIFAWLRMQGREDERVRVYGYTRSWSKTGSAVSVVIAAIIVLVSNSYSYIFLIAVVPYFAAIVNFMGYPRELDGTGDERPSIRAVIGHTIDTARSAVRRRGLRRLLLESMGFDGMFDAAKDYLQPVLEATAIAAAASFVIAEGWSDARRTALLVGPVYFVLYLLAAVASRNAHRVADAAGGEERAARLMWAAVAVVFATLGVAGWLDAHVVLIVGFVLLHVAHNLWRPVLIGRYDRHSPPRQGASLLSIENQARRAATMVIAPILGAAVDSVLSDGRTGGYWPVGAAGAAVAIVMLATSFGRRTLAPASESSYAQVEQSEDPS